MKKTNAYIDAVFNTQDALLEEVVASIAENGMPAISVSPSSGKLLTMLVAISGAKNILEIGALGGYSGICLAHGFGSEGKLKSLELEERYAEVAERNLTKAGFEEQISYLTGAALESLEKLIADKNTFDFFFIDADKENYENYLNGCLQLAESGALILSDNVLAAGSVVDDLAEPKRYTDIMKKYNDLVANHPRLESLLIPIGDGVTVSRVIN